MNPRIVKSGCFWIVLRYGHPVYIWFYDRYHDSWQEALAYAIKSNFWRNSK